MTTRLAGYSYDSWKLATPPEYENDGPRGLAESETYSAWLARKRAEYDLHRAETEASERKSAALASRPQALPWPPKL